MDSSINQTDDKINSFSPPSKEMRAKIHNAKTRKALKINKMLAILQSSTFHHPRYTFSDKYPGVSPYAYCAGNPVGLVDKDGREIYLSGDAWQTAIAFLQKICPNIHLNVSEDGLLSYEIKDNVKYSRKGEAKLSGAEKFLCEVIDSRTICISFTVNNSNKFQRSNGKTIRTDLGGGFGGSEYNGNGTADAEQFVSMNYVYKYFDHRDIGHVIKKSLR